MEIIFQVPSILERFDSIRDHEYTILPSPTQIQQLITPLITKALGLDNQLDSWCNFLPPTWKPTCTMSSSHLPNKGSRDMPPLFYQDPSTGLIKALQYINIWIPSIINFTRAVRIILHLFCLEALSYTNTTDSLQIHLSRQIIQEQVDLICATIASTLDCQIHDSRNFSDVAAETSARALGGYFLLWPLYNALEVPFLRQEQRKWLGSWLRFISEARDLSKLSFESCYIIS